MLYVFFALCPIENELILKGSSWPIDWNPTPNLSEPGDKDNETVFNSPQISIIAVLLSYKLVSQPDKYYLIGSYSCVRYAIRVL